MNSFKREVIQQNINGRQEAIAVYEINIYNFDLVSSQIGLEWPEEISQYIETPLNEVPDELVFKVNQRRAHDAFRDELLRRAEAERIEMSREQLILAALQKQLNELEVSSDASD